MKVKKAVSGGGPTSPQNLAPRQSALLVALSAEVSALVAGVRVHSSGCGAAPCVAAAGPGRWRWVAVRYKALHNYTESMQSALLFSALYAYSVLFTALYANPPQWSPNLVPARSGSTAFELCLAFS